MPDKAIISHRGEKYEIGRGKRFYGIWVIGAPYDAPVDRWPENRDGWEQAWRRFVAIEKPETITPVQPQRSGLRLRFNRGTDAPAPGAPGAPGSPAPGAHADELDDDLIRFGGSEADNPEAGSADARTTEAGFAGAASTAAGSPGSDDFAASVPPGDGTPLGGSFHVGPALAGTAPGGEGRRPGTALLAAEGLLVIGVVVGLAGLFPAYEGGQSLLSQGDQVVPHLCYVVGWAISAALIALGFARSGTARLGALFGLGLSAVTFGLFVADLGQVIQGGVSLGTGLVVSLLSWLACTAGSGLALGVGGSGQPADSPAEDAVPAGTEPGFAQPGYSPGYSHPGYASPGYGQQGYGPGYGQPWYGQPGFAQPGYARRAGQGIAGRSWLVWPSRAGAGPFALLLLAGIGTAAAFAPSWDSYTLTIASQGTAQTITAGNAFSNPGLVIFGNVAVMVAVVLVAALAALWRPPRQGALLLAGAIVPLAAQAVSALIQVSQPATAGMFGISSAQASEVGLAITSGVTSIFWVYCVFVISLLISCAWLMTSPTRPSMPPMPSMPWSPVPGDDAAANRGGADARDGADSGGGAQAVSNPHTSESTT